MQRGTERHRKLQRDVEKHRKYRRLGTYTGVYRQGLRNPEKSRKMERKIRVTQRDPELHK